MDGMLSQDEINALLNGIDTGTIDINDLQADSAPASSTQDGSFEPAAAVDDEAAMITEVERDAIGEIANISMGSAATTLYSLVNRKVNITTPVVTLATWSNVIEEYEKPCVFIQIKYTAGLDGNNILVLKESDVKIITDLMMGGDGSNIEGELGELHLSAISEAMNQMMGASATSLATMLGKMIDISPPEASLIDLTAVKNGADVAPFLGGTFVKIAFRMQIDDLVDSSIMQLYPAKFARYLCSTFLGTAEEEAESTPAPQPEPAAPQSAPQMDAGMQPQMGMPDMSGMNMGMGMQPQMGMPNMNGMNMGMGMQPQMGMPDMSGMNMGMGMQPQMGMMSQQMPPMQNMNIQPAQFQNFTPNAGGMGAPANIDLIMDVPLEVTVELGRTKKAISDVLDFSPGTIIELDKIAGEPVDVLVNGKLVARGEVVVIEESFGVRVTEIIK